MRVWVKVSNGTAELFRHVDAAQPQRLLFVQLDLCARTPAGLQAFGVAGVLINRLLAGLGLGGEP